MQNEYLNYYAINQAGGIAAAGENAFEDVDMIGFASARVRSAWNRTSPICVTAGLRLATGNTSDLVSETQTLNGTAPFAFGLDEAYIRFDKRNAQVFPGCTVEGRFLNPYETPTNLIFHGT